MAFEPFHLKKEREEGYFDPDGNYIQYKLDEVKDAWLDSLADGTLFACFGCLVDAPTQQCLSLQNTCRSGACCGMALSPACM